MCISISSNVGGLAPAIAVAHECEVFCSLPPSAVRSALLQIGLDAFWQYVIAPIIDALVDDALIIY